MDSKNDVEKIKKLKQQDKCIIFLMKKYKLNKDSYICNYAGEDCYRIGYYDEVDGIFYDEDGNSFLSIDNYEFLETDREYAFNRVMKIQELCDLYGYREMPQEGNIKKIIQTYYDEEICDEVSIVFDSLDDELLSFTTNLDIIFDYVYEIADAYEQVNNKNYYGDKDSEEIKNIISSVLAGNYSLDGLRELLKTISSTKDKYKKEEFDNLITSINKQIEVNEKVKDKVDIKNDNNTQIDSYRKLNLINIKDLYEKIKKTVVAQDDAVLRLVTEIASLDISDNKDDGILITGSTGVGKTKTMSLISKYLDRPFLIIDSTQLTMPGYVGKNIEECLYSLVKQCNFDIKKAENAIVYFDEIDKKGSSNKSDVSGQGVLNLLLKFLDGTTYTACENMQSEAFSKTYNINTSNMIVIAGGAFSDVYNSPDKNIKGFGNSQNSSDDINPTLDDFVNKGQMTNEFMGRFPSIIHFKDLDEKCIKEILEKSDESPIELEKKKFNKMGVKITFTTDYLDSVATMAVKRKTGVRGVRGVIKNTTWRPFSEVNVNIDKYGEVILSGDTVLDNNNYQMIKKKIIK